MNYKPLKQTTAITFRCELETAQQLDEICRVYGIKRSQFLAMSINSEYEKIHGNPQLTALMDQLREVSNTMQALTGRVQQMGRRETEQETADGDGEQA